MDTKEELECLGLADSIAYTLLNAARSNDADRFFTGFRRPSKTTRELMQVVEDNRTKRQVIYEG